MEELDQEVFNALEVLKKGGIILFPTDTIWGIGCDATNAKAIDKIYALKKRVQEKALICLVNDERMLEQYIDVVPKAAYDILKFAVTPTTIVFDKPIRVADNLVGQDNTLGIRVVKEPFCNKLIRKLRKPLVSTSANISGEDSPQSFSQISPEILKGVDYVVNLHHSKKSVKPSTIIKLTNDGKVQILRK